MIVRVRSTPRIGAALTACAVAAAIGIAPASAGKTTTVKLGDNFFSPTSKTVKKGTKVRFKWTGDNSHDVVKKRGPGKDFRSELTDDRGVNYSKRFRKAGTYKLICSIHSEMKMTLRVRR